MNKLKLFLIISLIVFGATVLFVPSTSVQASIIDNIKDLFDKEKEFTIQTDIILAPDGDINKNGELDAGDIVRFTYTITNTTDQEYSFGTIKTNIDRKQLNFIHNVVGTASLDDDGKTIEIPNFRISSNQTATITFDARVNYYTNEDPLIVTEAEFVDDKKNSIAKSIKKKIQAKRINLESVQGFIKQKINKERSK